MRKTEIPTLDLYSDWLKKSKYELLRFEDSFGVYDMANCFLTLNAIPEWIIGSGTSPLLLKDLAEKKLSIMKGVDFHLDEYQLDKLDHQLRLIRVFCNHSKHSSSKTYAAGKKFERISMCQPFPLTFPVKFEFLTVGGKNINVAEVFRNVINFWSASLRDIPE